MIEEIKENIFENEAHEDVQTLLDSYNEQMHKLLDSNNEQIMEVKTLVEGLHLILHSCPEGWNKFQMNCYTNSSRKRKSGVRPEQIVSITSQIWPQSTVTRRISLCSILLTG